MVAVVRIWADHCTARNYPEQCNPIVVEVHLCRPIPIHGSEQQLHCTHSAGVCCTLAITKSNYLATYRIAHNHVTGKTLAKDKNTFPWSTCCTDEHFNSEIFIEERTPHLILFVCTLYIYSLIMEIKRDTIHVIFIIFLNLKPTSLIKLTLSTAL